VASSSIVQRCSIARYKTMVFNSSNGNDAIFNVMHWAPRELMGGHITTHRCWSMEKASMCLQKAERMSLWKCYLNCSRYNTCFTLILHGQLFANCRTWAWTCRPARYVALLVVVQPISVACTRHIGQWLPFHRFFGFQPRLTSGKSDPGCAGCTCRHNVKLWWNVLLQIPQSNSMTYL